MWQACASDSDDNVRPFACQGRLTDDETQRDATTLKGSHGVAPDRRLRLYSIIRFWPKKAYRYRVWANVLIIIGTLAIAGAGSMARAGATQGLYFAEMVASAILLAGFLMASTLQKGA